MDKVAPCTSTGESRKMCHLETNERGNVSHGFDATTAYISVQ